MCCDLRRGGVPFSDSALLLDGDRSQLPTKTHRSTLLLRDPELGSSYTLKPALRMRDRLPGASSLLDTSLGSLRFVKWIFQPSSLNDSQQGSGSQAMSGTFASGLSQGMDHACRETLISDTFHPDTNVIQLNFDENGPERF